jgi:hypothetical protein
MRARARRGARLQAAVSWRWSPPDDYLLFQVDRGLDGPAVVQTDPNYFGEAGHWMALLPPEQGEPHARPR